MPLPPELKDLAARVSNWRRWGADDQRGTLNLIDAAAVLRGTAAVRRGAVFPLSIPMHRDGPQTSTRGAPGRTNPTLRMRYVNMAWTGDPSDFTDTDDLLELSLQAGTHLDALSHVSYEGVMFNGVPTSAVTEDDGATRLGIEHVGPVVTRGVLLDVAAALGVERLAPRQVVGAAELDAALARTGLSLAPGDAVLVRTGQMQVWFEAARGEREKDDYRIHAPGLGVSSVPWFREREVALVATDTYAFEVWPPEHEGAMMAVHMLNLRDVGLTQGQLWDLEALAADCAADGVHEFLLSATPLPVVGSVSGAVAPVAVK